MDSIGFVKTGRSDWVTQINSTHVNIEPFEPMWCCSAEQIPTMSTLQLTSLPLTSLPLTSLPLTSLPLTSLPLTSLLLTPLSLTPLSLTSLPLTSQLRDWMHLKTITVRQVSRTMRYVTEVPPTNASVLTCQARLKFWCVEVTSEHTWPSCRWRSRWAPAAS